MFILMLILTIPALVLYMRFQLAKSTIAPPMARTAKVAQYDRALRVLVENRRSAGGEWLCCGRESHSSSGGEWL